MWSQHLCQLGSMGKAPERHPSVKLAATEQAAQAAEGTVLTLFPQRKNAVSDGGHTVKGIIPILQKPFQKTGGGNDHSLKTDL